MFTQSNEEIRNSIYSRIIEISHEDEQDFTEMNSLWNQSLELNLTLNSAFKYYLPEFYNLVN